MNIRISRVCPSEIAGILDNSIRRWFQEPQKILAPYVNEGMTVLDLGCGPGFLSTTIAQIVGNSGRVIAADLQEGMLRKLRNKIRNTEFEQRITLHKCKEDEIGVSEKVDLVIAFYMLHEVPYQEKTLNEIGSILKPKGRLLLAEPYIHVSKNAFEKTIKKALNAGFTVVERPDIPFSRAVVLKKIR
ncbi:methyltransferase domain-containing protein [Methanolobus sp. ZRKC3]|uniref:class I SAM-dependent methyltransferase n=1 Tax=Methanolobus sp. ZRKC3 TaxID=3125786 RepID=UPI00325126A9